ncbi:Uncharacterised protein [Vibrio cholerae]|nr:Uncharacterised protein [Vibrio cholerae]
MPLQAIEPISRITGHSSSPTSLISLAAAAADLKASTRSRPTLSTNSSYSPVFFISSSIPKNSPNWSFRTVNAPLPITSF